jgi:exodeoxyribonuclease-3
MEICIWNINGITKKQDKIKTLLQEINSDILCFGETKTTFEYPILSDIEQLYPYKYYSICTKRKGYSGTCVYSKTPAVNTHEYEGDDEGRVVIVEYDMFILIHVYTPNAGRDLKRLSYRTEEWDVSFWNKVKEMKQIKEVIVCGDMNIIPNNNYIWKNNNKSAGCTKEERESFSTHLMDTDMKLCYEATDGNKNYSYWSTYGTSRQDNKGWLLDHFVSSNGIKVDTYDFLPHILGSDHCPVKMKFNIGTFISSR